MSRARDSGRRERVEYTRRAVGPRFLSPFTREFYSVDCARAGYVTYPAFQHLYVQVEFTPLQVQPHFNTSLPKLLDCIYRRLLGTGAVTVVDVRAVRL